jgi:ADP-ribose pyrophosphatase
VLNKSDFIHQGRVFKLFRDNVTLENGFTVDLDIVRHPGASAIVPLTDQHDIILIRQYRYAAGDFIWEIPAGTLEPEESPLFCARRELIEETGFSASAWEKLGEIIPVPGYSDERIHLFLAEDLVPSRQHLDRDEILEVHTVSFNDALSMIRSGKIVDGKTITGILLAKDLRPLRQV